MLVELLEPARAGLDDKRRHLDHPKQIVQELNTCAAPIDARGDRGVLVVEANLPRREPVGPAALRALIAAYEFGERTSLVGSRSFRPPTHRVSLLPRHRDAAGEGATTRRGG